MSVVYCKKTKAFIKIVKELRSIPHDGNLYRLDTHFDVLNYNNKNNFISHFSLTDDIGKVCIKDAVFEKTFTGNLNLNTNEYYINKEFEYVSFIYTMLNKLIKLQPEKLNIVIYSNTMILDKLFMKDFVTDYHKGKRETTYSPNLLEKGKANDDFNNLPIQFRGLFRNMYELIINNDIYVRHQIVNLKNI